MTAATDRKTTDTPIQRKYLRLLSDLYSFVRGAETNRAVAMVSHEQLIEEQIRRNGDSEDGNAKQFSPYAFDPNKEAPASTDPLARANFLGASDVNLPTKVQRILVMKNEIDATIAEILKIKPIEMSTKNLENPTAGDEILSTDKFEPKTA